MIDELLLQEESKTLEFKENLSSPLKIIRTVIAFANTAGGIILIGVEDETKAVVGLEDVLKEEERISNLLCDSICPMLIPDIDIVSHSGKEVIVINVPHMTGPYYLKKAGLVAGTYIRLGSSNRVADPETLANLQRLAKRVSFDEMPCIPADANDLNQSLIHEKLSPTLKNISKKHYESLGLTTQHAKKKYATYAGLLLFGLDKTKWLPDAIIKCVSFASKTKTNIIDKREITVDLVNSVDEAIIFIQRNTKVGAKIGAIKRTDLPEYPLAAVREAVINAIAHADYSIKGASIQISIYSDRIEITNPGRLTFGQTMDSALSGISKMRNPIIGRIFREIGIIETLGTGLLKITESYSDQVVSQPKFEEIDLFFKVTLYAKQASKALDEPWVQQLQEALLAHEEVTTSEMAKIWNVSVRTARARMGKLVNMNYIKRNAKSKNDPNATYSMIN